MERDPRAGVCNEVEELEGPVRSRSQTVEQCHAARSWSRSGCNKVWYVCRLLHKNWGQNKLGFGVFCSVLLSQEPQPSADMMRVMQEAKGRERGDDSDLRGGGCHRDAENASFGRWSHWDVKARGIVRCGQ